MKYQLEIQESVQESLKQRLLFQSLYQQAEELLAEELEFDKLVLPQDKWYTASFREVMNDGRIDGEYYQPNYKTIMNHL